MSLSRPSSSSIATGFLFTVRAPSSMPRTTVFGGVLSSGWFGGGGWGNEMSRPFWASGVTTMKMMRSTSITSMSGVMLMSAIEPRDEGFVASWLWMIQRRCLAMALALHLSIRDEGDFLHPRLAAEVHDLHDL